MVGVGSSSLSQSRSKWVISAAILLTERDLCLGNCMRAEEVEFEASDVKVPDPQL